MLQFPQHIAEQIGAHHWHKHTTFTLILDKCTVRPNKIHTTFSPVQGLSLVPAFTVSCDHQVRASLFWTSQHGHYIPVDKSLFIPPQCVIVDALCGIGAFSHVWFHLQNPVWLAFDADPVALACYADNFPNTRHVCLADINEISLFYLMRTADILCAGFPCQPFSSLGKGKGSHDHRDLLDDILNLIYFVRAPIVILENVKNFNAFHTHVYKLQRFASASGYCIYFEPSDAADIVPHHRKRLGILLIRSDMQGTTHSAKSFHTILRGGHPTPNTLQSRGILFEHPFAPHHCRSIHCCRNGN